MIVQAIKEQGLKELINEAISFYKHPNPAIYRSAVEKLWDALERVKTFYVPAGMDKKKSVETLIKSMANNQQHFFDLFTTEFRTLTEIGNNYRIRHHETDKYDINDDNYYEYFFNKKLCISKPWCVFGELWGIKTETLRTAYNQAMGQRKSLKFQDRLKRVG